MLEQKQVSKGSRPDVPLPSPVDLDQHIVEVLEDRTMLIVKKTQLDALVHLSSEETYRLALILRTPSWLDVDISKTCHSGNECIAVQILNVA